VRRRKKYAGSELLYCATVSIPGLVHLKRFENLDSMKENPILGCLELAVILVKI